MRKALPQMLNLSRELISHEGRAMQSSGAEISAAFVCEKLRPKLSTLMGATGFRALLARALALASAEVPSLGKFEIDSGDSLVYRKAMSGVAHSPDDEGGVVLVAQLLSLLVAFIGEKLTRQVLLEIWPQAFVRNSNFETGDSE
jgi:hypothetical protein